MAEPAHRVAAGHDMATPRALAVLDAASAEVRSVTEVGPYAAALGLAEPAAVTPRR